MTTSTSHVPVIETTVHKTHAWLEELAGDADLADQSEAFGVLRGVLHALRDQLTPPEAADLSAQLPMLIRGLFYEGWQGHGHAKHPRTRQDFLQRIETELAAMPGVDPSAAARAVFRLLDRHISEGEIQDVRSILPQHIRELWPEW